MEKTNDNGKALVNQPTFTVDRGNLDELKYAESLFAEAIRLGEADESDSGRFLKEVSGLLRRVIDAQSDGESTSVKAETAQRMVASILYVIGAELRRTPTPEQAVLRLLSDSAEKIYDDGLLLLNRIRSQAQMLRLLLVRTKKLDQSNDYYAFIDIVAKKYVEEYDPKFDAVKSVWVRVPELEMNENVKGMLDFYLFMRRLYEYNQE